MRLVILESPYAGDVDAHVAYARRCMKDSIMRGEAPFASHLLYTQPGILDDSIPNERQFGINAGLAWAEHAWATVVYRDLGISKGMQTGINRAFADVRPIIHRWLDKSDANLRDRVFVNLQSAFEVAHFEPHGYFDGATVRDIATDMVVNAEDVYDESIDKIVPYIVEWIRENDVKVPQRED